MNLDEKLFSIAKTLDLLSKKFKAVVLDEIETRELFAAPARGGLSVMIIDYLLYNSSIPLSPYSTLVSYIKSLSTYSILNTFIAPVSRIEVTIIFSRFIRPVWLSYY